MTNIIIVGSNGRFGKLIRRELENLNLEELTIYNADKQTEFFDWVWEQANYVIFAVPMRNLKDAILAYRDKIPTSAVVLDVCSLKVFACLLMEELLPGHQTIGTHPLFGPQSAKAGIEGQRIAICNISASEMTFLQLSDFLATKLKLRVFTCSPEEHDFQMAQSQALTHFIGRVAEKMDLQRLPLTTKSFDDLMDIIELVKGGTQELFEDMQQFNPYAKESRRQFLHLANELNVSLK